MTGPGVASASAIEVCSSRWAAGSPAAHRVRRCDRGQATVELALVLPVVVLLLLAVVQVGQLVRFRVMTIHTAREVARVAAVTPQHPTAAEVAERHGLDADRLVVRIDPPDEGFVRAEIVYDIPTDVAVVGALLPDVTVAAEAHMRVEWEP